jgi:peptidoglycan-associated lipoprotein
MKGSRSWFGIVALAAGACALGCSHEQKAPPAHPAPEPVAEAPRPPRRAPAPVEVASEAPAPPRAEPAIFFDFDSALLRPESHDVLQKMASSLRSRNAQLRIEGNCDELGTIEYNMALGEERARAAQTYLVHLGVPKGRLQTVSYGSQRPKYPGHDDDARARNRRDDLIVR